MRWILRRRPRDERGAAAVEFALVCVVFIPMLLGVIQYGLFFNDSLNVRQGVRQAAREGVVKSFAACTASPTPTADLDKLRCSTKKYVKPVTGPTYVRIYATPSWAPGNKLTVCTMVASGARNMGLAPVPNGGVIKSKVSMAIEQGSGPSVLSSQDAAPAGQDWSWC